MPWQRLCRSERTNDPIGVDFVLCLNTQYPDTLSTSTLAAVKISNGFERP